MNVLGTQLTAMRQRPARVLLTGLALIVTSFVVFGTVLARDIVRRTVLGEASGTPAAVDLVVTGTQGDPAAVLRRLRGVPGVAEVSGRTSAFYPLRHPTVDDLIVTADPGTGPLSRVRVEQGRYPRAADQIAITRHTATAYDVGVGDRLTLQVGDPDRRPHDVTLTVTAIVAAPRDSAQDAYTTDRYALGLADQPALDEIDVRLAPGTGADAVTPRLRAVLGTGPVIQSGREVRDAEAADAVRQLNDVFVLISLFVTIAVAAATLVATSTFRIVFAQRLRQLALLRVVGAGRGALFRALVGEGVLTGAVAGLAGVAGASAAAHLLPVALRANGIRIAAPGPQVLPAVAVVLGAALLAAVAVVAPALSAARVAPLEALRIAGTTAGRPGVGPLRAALGVLLAVGAIGTAGLEVLSRDGASTALLLLVVSGTLAFFALVLLGPVLLRPVLRVVGWPLRCCGTVGRLAVGGIGGAPRRSAAVSVVVALGVTLVAGVLVGHASLAAAAERKLAAAAPADVRLTVGPGRSLPGDVVDRARQRPELTRVLPYREVSVGIAGQSDAHLALDLDMRQLSTAPQLAAVVGPLPSVAPGQVVLRASVAEAAGIATGATILIAQDRRTLPVRVVALLADLPLDADVLAAPADFDRLGVAPAPTALIADAAAGSEKGRASAVRAMRTVARTADGSSVESLADLRDRDHRVLDELLVVALGLIGMTVLVAIVGVGSTTALSIVERVGESGLLRAVGLSRRRLLAMLTLEAALYGVLGGVLGLLLAIPYAGLAVAALPDDLPVRLPAGQLAGVVLLLAALTAVAGLPPAIRASRVSPVAALAVTG